MDRPDGPSAHGTARPSRRSVIGTVGLTVGVAWVAPSVISLDRAFALGSVPPPVFVAGSAATDYDGPSFSDKTIDLASGSLAQPLLPGDLWVVYLSYDARGTIAVPAGWSSSTVATGNSGGAGAIYSVESVVLWRTLTAGDIIAGVASQTFTAAGADLTYGGLRGSAVAYRGSNLAVTSQTNGTGQGAGLGSTATATFPANTATAPNIVLRLGAGRGYGAFTSISWAGGTGVDRVNFDAGNSGDRAQVINEQVDDAGGTANRTINVGRFGNRSRTTATLVITAS